MNRFTATAVRFDGTFLVEQDVDLSFKLFSPEGEKSWVPGWDPEYIFPPGEKWSEGQIFRTREGEREAVWIVTLLDRSRNKVVYHRVETGLFVARIEVVCSEKEKGMTVAAISYSFIGLSTTGNDAIQMMTKEEFQGKMKKWRSWIDECISSR